MHAGSATRRGFLTASAVAAAAPARATGASESDPFAATRLQQALERYASFGDKASGGPGDDACGHWLEAELTSFGFDCRRQTYSVPYFVPTDVALSSGAVQAQLIPQAVVVQTPPGGLSGPLHLLEPNQAEIPRGAIVLVPLPARRWSALKTPQIMSNLQRAFQQGAAAVVVVTNGPTGEALALNAPVDRPVFDKPVVIMAPLHAEPFLKAAREGARGVLTVTGAQGRRSAFNNIGVLSGGHSRTMVVSTPRSGWFNAVGERGPGLAVWLGLARWAGARRLPVNLIFLCTSGHEYDNAGGVAYLEHLAPPPAATVLWAHLGANVAARDWHELGPTLTPLSSADPQRYMVASPPLLEAVRTAFAGQPGLQDPYPTSGGAAGELTHIIAAGYPQVFGIFGAHRFHHAPSDDLRCVLPAPVANVGRAYARVIEQAVGAWG